ncbi:MAG: hypothetical protein IH820_09445, partial [Bacteroidetes bacterium]|nr:hypothetical protein [Bacteroidota bacterium]
EHKPEEYRVALTPAGTEALTSAGHQVLIEADAGLGSGFTDDFYADAGAEILDVADEIWSRAEMVMKVKEPIEPEWPKIREGQVLFTYLHLASSLRLTEALRACGVGTGDEVLLPEPVIFADDTTQYWYRFDTGKLLAGWQYLFNITAFDEGDPDAGLESFESSRTANAARIFPGTPPADTEDLKVGVYPNPYRVNAAWDGGTNRTRKLNFYNVPPRAQIRIYTLAGEIVATLDHEADTYTGDIRWYDNFSADNRFQPGGEHSWDVLSENNLNLAGGLYLFTVKNLDSGRIQRGKFVIIK